MDSEVHSEGAQDTVATDVDAAVHSDGDKAAFVYSKGPNAVVDSIAHHEGTAFATDVDAAVHSVGDQAKPEETLVTDVDAIIHSEGNTTATDVDSDLHSERTRASVLTDVDSAVNSDGDKVMGKKSPTIDVAVVQPEGPNAVADAVVYSEGVSFATDVNAAVHSVREKARTEERCATDVDAIIHSEGNSIATDMDSDAQSAGAQDTFTTEADAAVHSLQHSQSQLGRPEHYFQNKGDPLQNLFCLLMKLIK